MAKRRKYPVTEFRPRVRTPLLPFPPRIYRTQRVRTPVLVGPARPDIPPESWTGSMAEWWVYSWLIARGLIEGVDFTYQREQLGGRDFPGGGVLDFWFPARWTFWRIQGTYWHYRSGPEVIGRDVAVRLRLESSGYTVIDILDYDLEEPKRRNEVLEAALDGIELLPASIWRNL